MKKMNHINYTRLEASIQLGHSVLQTLISSFFVVVFCLFVYLSSSVHAKPRFYYLEPEFLI